MLLELGFEGWYFIRAVARTLRSVGTTGGGVSRTFATAGDLCRDVTTRLKTRVRVYTETLFNAKRAHRPPRSFRNSHGKLPTRSRTVCGMRSNHVVTRGLVIAALAS